MAEKRKTMTVDEYKRMNETPYQDKATGAYRTKEQIEKFSNTLDQPSERINKFDDYKFIGEDYPAELKERDQAKNEIKRESRGMGLPKGKYNPILESGKTYKSGGKVSASSRADGCCVKGKTKGRMIWIQKLKQ